MSKSKLFATEAELVAKFAELVTDYCSPERWERNRAHQPKWTLYHETAGWDLLLAHETGAQIGVEAKLTLNPKVLEQALPGRWADVRGPDFRAVLVPDDGLQNHTASLARHLGIAVITVRVWDTSRGLHDFSPKLPSLNSTHDRHDWPDWMPGERCKLPEYVPDVVGGHAAPIQLSEWKIKAIKLLILLDRRGYVTRRDMKALGISPTRWTDHFNGFLSPDPQRGGYVRNGRTPDLKAQHPTVWPQIEADFEAWGCGLKVAARLGLEGAA